jgi:hypothetical protein
LATSSAGHPIDHTNSGSRGRTSASGGSNAVPPAVANGNVVRPFGSYFFVNPRNGSVISSPPFPAGATANQLETVDRAISETGSSQRSVVEVVGGERKRGGLLAWLGC